MANTKKMTKRDYFTAILSKYPLTAEEKAFVEHELELLAKKNSAEKKPTAAQVANEGIKSTILDVLTANPNRLMTITEMMKEDEELGELTNQKISALLTQLVKAGEIVRTEVKGKAYFALAEQE